MWPDKHSEYKHLKKKNTLRRSNPNTLPWPLGIASPDCPCRADPLGSDTLPMTQDPTLPLGAIGPHSKTAAGLVYSSSQSGPDRPQALPSWVHLQATSRPDHRLFFSPGGSCSPGYPSASSCPASCRVVKWGLASRPCPDVPLGASHIWDVLAPWSYQLLWCLDTHTVGLWKNVQHLVCCLCNVCAIHTKTSRKPHPHLDYSTFSWEITSCSREKWIL